MRAMWKGSLVVGKVAVPVSLAKSAAHVDDLELRTLHAPCGSPLTQERRCPTCDVAVAGDADAVMRGFEYAPGQFVPISSDELEQALAGRQVVLDRFVPSVLLEPAMLDTTYWLAPSSDPLAVRAYDALLQALERTHLVGLGRLAFYSRERVAAVWPVKVDGVGAIVGLTTLYPVGGIRVGDAAEIRTRVKSLGAAAATPEEVELFAEAIRQRHVPAAFRWRALQRYFPSRLRELVLAKQVGGPVVVAPAADPVAPRDLAAALRKSLRSARRRAGAPA